MSKENKYPHYDAVFGYAKSIVDGKKIACLETQEMCQRFFSDLENPNYEFKPMLAEVIIKVIETTFVHTKGDRFYGKPFLLEPWELFIVYNLFGFYIAGTMERRFKEAFIYVPRKNGKTPFVAALAWAISFVSVNFAATLYIIGNVLKQARGSFEIILKNLEFMGEISRFRVLDNNNEHSISRQYYDSKGYPAGSMHIEALASANPDNLDSLNAPFIIADEIHAYRKPEQYTIMKDAMKAYENKLLFGITTAGRSMASFGFSRFSYCKKILDGVYKDEQYFVFIAKADNPDDYTNPIEHEKANPNYGVTIRPEDILNDSLQAQNDPKIRNNFLNKSLNIYTNVLGAYFDIFEVQTSDECYDYTLEQLARLPIKWNGGADLSVMHDLTAGVLYGEYNDVGIVIAHGFIPILQAQKKADDDEIPFFWWEEKGWLTMCNSDVVDYEEVVKWFVKMRNFGFKIKSVAFDKFKSRDFVRSMKKAKFRMEISDQQYWKKSEAFREIERKIKSKKFTYMGNKAFEYCISNVTAIEDSEDQVRYKKIDEHRRMDLFDATVMACKQLIIDKDKSKKTATWFGEEGEK